MSVNWAITAGVTRGMLRTSSSLIGPPPSRRASRSAAAMIIPGVQ